VECARRNIDDPRADIAWADATDPAAALEDLDFVVMNPPFHDGGAEDRALGQAFIAAAAKALRKGGECWLVANRHLPYEVALNEHFSSARPISEGRGFKLFQAIR
jgi:16S rRNA (guanine1207-N2)-methyltransferase